MTPPTASPRGRAAWALAALAASLHACAPAGGHDDDPPADDDSADPGDDDSADPGDDDSAFVNGPVDVPSDDQDPWHVLVSSDHGDSPAITEWDLAWNVTWYVPVIGAYNAEGFVRQADGSTIFVEVNIPFRRFGIIEYDRLGLPTWQYQGGQGNLQHAHDVALTPDGGILVADTDASRVFEMDRDENLRWTLDTLPDGTELKYPNGMELAEVDGEILLVVSARTFVSEGNDGFQAVILFRYLGPDEPPEFLWRFPEEVDLEVLSVPHGPHFTADGGVMVTSSSHGQVVGLDPSGQEMWRLPPPDDEVVFDHPRDALFTPDGTLLVADTFSERIMEIGDPFGTFDLLREAPLEGNFRLSIVDCARAEDGSSTACF
ncbi:hypothetical protein L6R50_11070 [Myxococcota bacterium]|nr:hypothetical protein [Myxococcota bacterium]